MVKMRQRTSAASCWVFIKKKVHDRELNMKKYILMLSEDE